MREGNSSKFEASLFLGFPVTENFTNSLNRVPPEDHQLFINNHSPYLYNLSFEGAQYLGKFVGSSNNYEELKLIEANIYSILKKIIPDFNYQKVPLLLFSV